jgi:membrane protease YdiL (CAAX protease family)
MKLFKNFAVKRPFLFGIALILLYAMLSTLAYPVHFLFPENEVEQLYGDAAAKLIVFLVFLTILWRFGWIPRSGITRSGNIKFWLIITGLIIFCALAKLIAFTGSITITFPNPELAAANLILAFSTGLVEEIMVRGLVLIAMILAWGSTRQGYLKAILFSSMLFGLAHLFNIMIRPIGVVVVQALILTMPGIFYATLVLACRSLWPAIVIHWLGNAAVNIKLISAGNYQETFMMWLIYAISLIPLMVVSAFLFPGLLQTNDMSTNGIEKELITQKPSGTI